mmetsp:Transcript_2905/g.7806  ORF Transcript_2905/g.7806 Transcript_2905/m.7806 type:complete len:573 (+) Transcript_2905:94-1812(+)
MPPKSWGSWLFSSCFGAGCGTAAGSGAAGLLNLPQRWDAVSEETGSGSGVGGLITAGSAMAIGTALSPAILPNAASLAAFSSRSLACSAESFAFFSISWPVALSTMEAMSSQPVCQGIPFSKWVFWSNCIPLTFILWVPCCTTSMVLGHPLTLLALMKNRRSHPKSFLHSAMPAMRSHMLPMGKSDFTCSYIARDSCTLACSSFFFCSHLSCLALASACIRLAVSGSTGVPSGLRGTPGTAFAASGFTGGMTNFGAAGLGSAPSSGMLAALKAAMKSSFSKQPAVLTPWYCASFFNFAPDIEAKPVAAAAAGVAAAAAGWAVLAVTAGCEAPSATLSAGTRIWPLSNLVGWFSSLHLSHRKTLQFTQCTVAASGGLLSQASHLTASFFTNTLDGRACRGSKKGGGRMAPMPTPGIPAFPAGASVGSTFALFGGGAPAPPKRGSSSVFSSSSFFCSLSLVVLARAITAAMLSPSCGSTPWSTTSASNSQHQASSSQLQPTDVLSLSRSSVLSDPSFSQSITLLSNSPRSPPSFGTPPSALLPSPAALAFMASSRLSCFVPSSCTPARSRASTM